MISRQVVKFLVTSFLLAALLALHARGSVQAQEGQHYTSDVRVHMSQNPDKPLVPGASATLATDAGGATVSFHTTQLEPGHVYTLWGVIINAPEQCSAAPCPTQDILGKPDLVRADVTYATGLVAGEGGEATFEAHLPAGDVPNGWFGNGFNNPTGAEIHLVLNDHGPVIEELRDSMLTSYRGGCTDESLPPPFPATAKAHGTPGPNTCRLVQFAIFQQTAPATLPETGSDQPAAWSLWLAILGGGTLLTGWLLRRRVSRV